MARINEPTKTLPGDVTSATSFSEADYQIMGIDKPDNPENQHSISEISLSYKSAETAINQLSEDTNNNINNQIPEKDISEELEPEDIETTQVHDVEISESEEKLLGNDTRIIKRELSLPINLSSNSQTTPVVKLQLSVQNKIHDPNLEIVTKKHQTQQTSFQNLFSDYSTTNSTSYFLTTDDETSLTRTSYETTPDNNSSSKPIYICKKCIKTKNNNNNNIAPKLEIVLSCSRCCRLANNDDDERYFKDRHQPRHGDLYSQSSNSQYNNNKSVEDFHRRRRYESEQDYLDFVQEYNRDNVQRRVQDYESFNNNNNNLDNIAGGYNNSLQDRRQLQQEFDYFNNDSGYRRNNRNGGCCAGNSCSCRQFTSNQVDNRNVWGDIIQDRYNSSRDYQQYDDVGFCNCYCNHY